MSEAVVEAVLIAKKAREEAEAAHAALTVVMEELAETERVVAHWRARSAEYQQEISTLKRKLGAAQASIKELQDSLDPTKPDEVEVIAFVDSSGHQVAINCTGAAQKIKVLREIVEAAVHHGHIDQDDTEHYDVSALLKSGTADELSGLIYDSDIPQSGTSREGFSPIRARNDWPLELGFDD